MPGMVSSAIDNDLDRLWLRADPKCRFGHMRQLTVLDMTTSLLELVKQKREIDTGRHHGCLVRIRDRKIRIGRRDLLELYHRMEQRRVSMDHWLKGSRS